MSELKIEHIKYRGKMSEPKIVNIKYCKKKLIKKGELDINIFKNKQIFLTGP